jgi:GT2 family glycosyltransferase
MPQEPGRASRWSGVTRRRRENRMNDLAVIIVSTNEGHWLEACLPTVFGSAGALDLDVVVVDNDSRDGTAELVAERFPRARVVRSANHGFPHANNRALYTVDARYVLFLNPDTEILEGSLEDLVQRMDAAPEIGLAGCRQETAEGELWPTMRRFPTPLRLLFDALGAERLPRRASWMGMRELDRSRYATEFDLDWTSGSFVLMRRETLAAVGWWDERFFLYSDEVDLAQRVQAAGWVVRHLPQMRIVHHAQKQGFNPKGFAQFGYSHRLYARKHLQAPHRGLYLGALALFYGSRAVAYRVLRRSDPQAAAAMRRGLSAVLGRCDAPYEPEAPAAVRPEVPARVEESSLAAR